MLFYVIFNLFYVENVLEDCSLFSFSTGFSLPRLDLIFGYLFFLDFIVSAIILIFFSHWVHYLYTEMLFIFAHSFSIFPEIDH